MALRNIPIDKTQPNHEFSLTLEGVTYIFNFILNIRDGRWYMTIKRENGNVIVASIPLVVNSQLIGKFATKDLPPGEILCIDDTGKSLEPGPDSFGETHSLIYLESVA